MSGAPVSESASNVSTNEAKLQSKIGHDRKSCYDRAFEVMHHKRSVKTGQKTDVLISYIIAF
jgi:hypothetical protein